MSRRCCGTPPRGEVPFVHTGVPASFYELRYSRRIIDHNIESQNPASLVRSSSGVTFLPLSLASRTLDKKDREKDGNHQGTPKGEERREYGSSLENRGRRTTASRRLAAVGVLVASGEGVLRGPPILRSRKTHTPAMKKAPMTRGTTMLQLFRDHAGILSISVASATSAPAIPTPPPKPRPCSSPPRAMPAPTCWPARAMPSPRFSPARTPTLVTFSPALAMPAPTFSPALAMPAPSSLPSPSMPAPRFSPNFSPKLWPKLEAVRAGMLAKSMSQFVEWWEPWGVAVSAEGGGVSAESARRDTAGRPATGRPARGRPATERPATGPRRTA
mmetsp:Transcript_9421/g.38553  ORF Transcript_9421/g.38553 Transcript_9421/m.38553 type:complete len:330 (-) Transcript_9421:284-1273(-)